MKDYIFYDTNATTLMAFEAKNDEDALAKFDNKYEFQSIEGGCSNGGVISLEAEGLTIEEFEAEYGLIHNYEVL